MVKMLNSVRHEDGSLPCLSSSTLPHSTFKTGRDHVDLRVCGETGEIEGNCRRTCRLQDL